MRYLYILVLFISVALSASAQSDFNDGKGPQPTMDVEKLRFIYVAPDNTMNQQGLIDALVDHHNHIVAEESPAIFYLSFKPEPVIVKMNTGNSDNPDDFESQLLYTLRQTMAYSVTPDEDRNNILKLLAENDFVDENNNLKVQNMEFDFHVGKSFWDAGNNESIIAAIYFDIDAKKFIEDNNMQFNVIFRCPPSRGNIDREKPFGDMNLDEINEIVIPSVRD